MEPISSVGLTVTGGELLKTLSSVQSEASKPPVPAGRKEGDEAVALPEIKPTVNDLDQVTRTLNKVFGTENTQLNIHVQEPSKKIVIQVIDVDSAKVIRQIPPEEILRLAEKIDQLMQGQGNLINTKV